MCASSIQIISFLDRQSKFHMLHYLGNSKGKALATRLCPLQLHQHGGSILGSVNLCKIFRQILEDKKNVQT